MSNTTDCAVGDVITDINLLEKLPEGTVVTTGDGDTREKTWSGDEWDSVMLGEEILMEGKGSVTVVFLSGKRFARAHRRGASETSTSAKGMRSWATRHP